MNYRLQIILLMNFLGLCCKDHTDTKILPIPFMATTLSESGLILREEPKLQSKKVTLIPHMGIFEVTAKTSEEATIDKKHGLWLRAHFYDVKGYVFSAYTISFNDLSAKRTQMSKKTILGSWFGDTKWPGGQTTLNLHKDGTFKFLIFSGGDEGGFGDHTVTGTWSISEEILKLLSDDEADVQSYFLLDSRLILIPKRRYKNKPSQFMENYSSEYVTGLWRR
jgi:hypothetical protein